MKKYFHDLTKKAFLNSYRNKRFLIINFNEQELIYHIHFFWIYIFSSKQIIEILLISYVFITWFLLWILFIEYVKHFLVKKISLYSLWPIVATTFFSHPLHFYTRYCHLPKTNTSLASIEKNSSIGTLPFSSSILPTTNLFGSS